MTDQPKTAKERILSFVEKNPGMRSSEIARNLHMKNQLVCQTLSLLLAEKTPRIHRSGKRRAYTYTIARAGDANTTK